jgi:hypothetical protein
VRQRLESFARPLLGHALLHPGHLTIAQPDGLY